MRLGIDLGRGGIHWAIASVTVLIDVAANGDFYLGLGLNLNGLFNQTAPTVQLSAFFINPQPN